MCGEGAGFRTVQGASHLHRHLYGGVDACRTNLFDYMHTHLGVPRDRAEQIWRPLFARYNQSLRGLRAGGYSIEADEYWDCMRAGAEEHLEPDAQVS
jgi:hypothetical protein